MNILFVEDHAIFAEMVRRKFLRDHSVVVAPSLSAAERALRANAFDLLLLDYDLPDGKGDSLVRSASSKGAIVIAVSSHDEGNNALMKAGAAGVCSKMNFDEIERVIESVMRRASR